MNRELNVLRYLGAFLLGAFLLSFFSVFQKKAIGLPILPIQLKAFVVPLGFGGIAGLSSAFFYFRLQNKTHELEEYLDSIDNLVQIVSAERKFLYVNQAWLDTLQYTREEVNDLRFEDILHPTHKKACICMEQRILGGEDFGEFESIFVAKDGSAVYVRGTSSGSAKKTRGIFKNITAEHESQEFQRLSKYIFAHTKEGLLITNKDWMITSSNAAYTAISGYQAEDLVGKSAQNFFNFKENSSVTLAEITKTVDEYLHWQGELLACKKDAPPFPARASFSAVTTRNGVVSQYFCLLDDISKDKQNETELKYMALYDPLTELPNRHHFYERLQQAIACSKSEEKNFAVFFLDLDGFKNVNDQYGHAKGDQLLQAVARRLKNSLREVDAVARLGGDEFGVLVEETHEKEKVRAIAGKLAKKINAPYNLNDITIHIATSIGVSFFPEAATPDDLIKMADYAMYAAKKTPNVSVMLMGEDLQPAA